MNEEIFNDLYNKIKSNFYSVGDVLPTEAELQNIYGVSRAPVRQALAKLKTEGFITGKPGIGTIVAENSVSAPWMPMGGFSSQFRNTAGDLTCKTLDVSKVIADKEITDIFKLEEDSSLIKVSRLRKEKDKPIFILNSYYNDVDINKIKEAGDILYMRQFASEVLGINFEYVKEEIKAAVADSHLSSILEVREGAPLLKINRVSYDSDYNPVEYVEYYVDTEQWPYTVVFSKDGHEFEY
ncbi:GntR family transcriptional regulator [Halobacillus campisalis]|uniref:GntR family transcriptional regulator n=1 Tax=Halobacillus campisalis TaxID=435909 RepID=A0ABW2JY69_9BACI|nr:GntR family transcriptional regulator [Halobacillus campisalis]